MLFKTFQVWLEKQVNKLLFVCLLEISFVLIFNLKIIFKTFKATLIQYVQNVASQEHAFTLFKS